MSLTRPPLDVVPPLMELFTSPSATDDISIVVLIAIQNLLRAAQKRPNNNTNTNTSVAASDSNSTPSAAASAASLSPSVHSNPVIGQVNSGGGPTALAKLRDGRPVDSPIARKAQEILEEFFPKFRLTFKFAAAQQHKNQNNNKNTNTEANTTSTNNTSTSSPTATSPTDVSPSSSISALVDATAAASL